MQLRPIWFALLTIQNVKMKKRKKGRDKETKAVNIVRVSVKALPAPKAGDAFTETRLMSAFRVSTGLHVEHRRPKAAMLHMKVC